MPFAGTGGDWGQRQSRAVPQPTPGTAGGARGWVTHLTDLGTHQKAPFLSSGLVPKRQRLPAGARAFAAVA